MDSFFDFYACEDSIGYELSKYFTGVSTEEPDRPDHSDGRGPLLSGNLPIEYGFYYYDSRLLWLSACREYDTASIWKKRIKRKTTKALAEEYERIRSLYHRRTEDEVKLYYDISQRWRWACEDYEEASIREKRKKRKEMQALGKEKDFLYDKYMNQCTR